MLSSLGAYLIILSLSAWMISYFYGAFLVFTQLPKSVSRLDAFIAAVTWPGMVAKMVSHLLVTACQFHEVVGNVSEEELKKILDELSNTIKKTSETGKDSPNLN